MEFTTEENAVSYLLLNSMASINSENDSVKRFNYMLAVGELNLSLLEKDIGDSLTFEQGNQILKGMSKEKKIKLIQMVRKMVLLDGKMHPKEKDFYIYLCSIMGLREKPILK
jgi:uncharacterized membrane protein YciS (DUF1049 family)